MEDTFFSDLFDESQHSFDSSAKRIHKQEWSYDTLEHEWYELNGIRDGPFIKYWNYGGEIKYTYNYRNGEIDGFYRSFFADGNLRLEIIFENGIPNDISKMFDESGKETSIFPDSISYFVYENGEIEINIWTPDYDEFYLNNSDDDICRSSVDKDYFDDSDDDCLYDYY